MRLIGVGVSGLGPPLRQLSLWAETSKRRDLEKILDGLNERFGKDIIQRGNFKGKQR